MSRRRPNLDFDRLSKDVDLETAKKEQTVLYGLVISCQKAATVDKEETLVVEVDGKRVLLLKSEVGYMAKRQPIYNLVGRVLSIVITSYDSETGLAFGSHEKATAILAIPIIEELKNGGQMMGVVRRLEPFGAYVSIADGVFGVLRNSDITNGLGTARETLTIGQTVRVEYKGEAPNKTIYLKLAEKIKDDFIVGTTFAELEEGQFVFGTVLKVIPTGVFVKVANNVTVFTPIPRNWAVKRGMYVRVEITGINEEKEQAQGIICAKLG